MPITLRQASSHVLRHLDDETEDVWTRVQINNWVQDGYDELCRQAEVLFDMVMYDRQTNIGNYTRECEKDYMDGMPIFGRFNFTRESEREYMGPGAVGPANHTKPSDAQYMTDEDEPPTAALTRTLPDNFTSVVRVTHDWLRLNPESARYLRDTRGQYRTEQGGTFSYSMDQDGLFQLRMVGVPEATPADMTTISGTYGFIRAFSESEYDYDDETYQTTNSGFGMIRQVPKEFVGGEQQYGFPRRVIQDSNATRVEIFRLGKRLSENATFEIPDRAVKYCEWWALHRAYSEPGEGEDRKMADHYRSRFDMGVKRIKNRLKAVNKERTGGMGRRRLGSRDSYLQMFPSDYGYKTPFRA